MGWWLNVHDGPRNCWAVLCVSQSGLLTQKRIATCLLLLLSISFFFDTDQCGQSPDEATLIKDNQSCLLLSPNRITN